MLKSLINRMLWMICFLLKSSKRLRVRSQLQHIWKILHLNRNGIWCSWILKLCWDKWWGEAIHVLWRSSVFSLVLIYKKWSKPVKWARNLAKRIRKRRNKRNKLRNWRENNKRGSNTYHLSRLRKSRRLSKLINYEERAMLLTKLMNSRRLCKFMEKQSS